MENWRRRITKDNNFRVVRRPGGGQSSDGTPVKAVVKTAQPLTPEMESMLRTKLAAASGRDIEIVNVVDPTVVAGMIVQLGSRLIDMSLAAQLNDLSHRIERALNRSVQNLSAWDLSADELRRMGSSL